MNEMFPTRADLSRGLLERMLRLIVRKHELLGPEHHRMLARYTVALGSIETELRTFEIQVQRLRRRIQLMETFGFSQDPDQAQEIDRVLAQEFYQAEIELLEQMRAVDQARSYLRGPIPTRQTNELQAVFREMVFKLHPVFHPEQTEVMQELLHEVIEAYELSDHDSLMELYETIKPMPEPERPSPDLIKQIYQTESEIEAIWGNFPYNQRDLLQDDVKLAQRQAELYAQISAKKEELAAWTNHYAMLIRNRQSGHLIN